MTRCSSAGGYPHLRALQRHPLPERAAGHPPSRWDAACCASNDPALHEKALDVLEDSTSMSSTGRSGIIRRWRRSGPAAACAYQQRRMPGRYWRASWTRRPVGAQRQQPPGHRADRADPGRGFETINQAVRQAYLRYPLMMRALSTIAAGCRAARADDYCFTFQAPVLVIAAGRRDNQNAMADSACMLENLMLAAHSLGVGSCYINPPRWMGETTRPAPDAVQNGRRQQPG